MNTSKEGDKKLEWWKILLIILCIILGLLLCIMAWSWYFRGERLKQKKKTGYFHPTGTRVGSIRGKAYFDPNAKVYDLSSYQKYQKIRL